ncbi:MAG: PhzF family isomerase [Deltaproteobacteria bacterium]|nr:PhzF family isomerase [Deltaproteobacteria bacterium]
MKSCRLYQVDAFTTEPFRGNPAGVVPDADGLSDVQMQAIAREVNASETAFILSPPSSDCDLQVRFFTPTTEVPSCGHATVAAHTVRALENDLPSCTVRQKTRLGILPVEVIREGQGFRIVMTQGAIEFGKTFFGRGRDQITAALGLSRTDLDERCPVQIVSTGHAKVLVGIRDRATLDALKPDLARLTELSRRIGCNGYFIFTLASEYRGFLSYGRMFAPAIGIAEDPVTGNANGPLGAYLVQHKLVPTEGNRLSFRGRQGEAIGRPGTVEVSVEIEAGKPRTVRVGGQAVIVFRTEIRF